MKSIINGVNTIASKLDELIFYYELAVSEDDKLTLEETAKSIINFENKIRSLELNNLFVEEDDRKNAIVTINAGSGGTEAQDWANMLFRMYHRWATKKGFDFELLACLAGEEAGIKSIDFVINGMNAYGYLKSEIGVHRLIRNSPFDANKRRHTSFAAVYVTPEMDKEIYIEIKDDDLRIDTLRGTGSGGQHKNVTDSAVRLTHKPTGIVVFCQNERSQTQNKETAMRILKIRIYEHEKKLQNDKLQETFDAMSEITWGSQIRSYFVHPKQLIKDHRTNHEVGSFTRVIDGEIDEFIEKFLLTSKQ